MSTSFPILITIVILCSLVLFCFKTNPGAPLVVKNSPSNAEGVGLIPGEGAGIPYASKPKTQSVKEKQCCSKFNKDFDSGPHQQNLFKSPDFSNYSYISVTYKSLLSNRVFTTLSFTLKFFLKSFSNPYSYFFTYCIWRSVLSFRRIVSLFGKVFICSFH